MMDNRFASLKGNKWDLRNRRTFAELHAKAALAEDAEEDEDEETTEESVDALSLVTKMMARVEALESEVDELKKENAELKKSNRKKEKKLKAIKEADKEFTERFKGLSVSLGLTKDDSEEKQEVTERRYASGDGIGEMK